MAPEWVNEKIYDRCCYLNCYNGKYSTGHKLFRFPVFTDSRHHLWIRYTGNVRLRTWASTTIRRAGICAEHFSPECFVDKTRKTLRRHAVPNPYSATEAKTKPSPKLLAHIKSLPRKQTASRKTSDSKDTRSEVEEQSSQQSSDADEMKCVPKNPMPTERHVIKVKTLRNVKRLKIEEQVSNSNRTVILERCQNPDTCPAGNQVLPEGTKPRPHFHKVYANSLKKPRASITYAKPLKVRKSEDSNSGLDQPKVKDIVARPCVETVDGDPQSIDSTTVNDKKDYQLEKFHINISKASPKKEEPSSTTRYSEDLENSDWMSDWQAIQKARKHAQNKYLSAAEITKYSKARVEKSADRCAYVNCNNGRLTTGAHLFRFPKITDPRLTTWIKNAGNPRMLYWSCSTIRQAGLCADHFTDESFYNETRQRLLRTAVPKPFYLEKDLSLTEKQDKNLSHDDLLKVFHIIENEQETQSESPLIDLPNGTSENPENLKIKYPFDDMDASEANEEAEASDAGQIKEESNGSFASVLVKTEPVYQPEASEVDELFFASSGLACVKDELVEEEDEEEEEDPLDDASNANSVDLEEDAAGVDNIRKILALQQQKARLREVIKQFSSKLKDAQIHKNKLRSKLLAYSDLQTR